MVLLVDNKEIIETKVAKSMFARMKGLMGKKNIDYGLFFYPCNNIHTFFMKEAIDVLYLDKKGYIISIDNKIEPWKIGRIVKGGKSLIELPQGTIDQYNIKIGQLVEFNM